MKYFSEAHKICMEAPIVHYDTTAVISPVPQVSINFKALLVYITTAGFLTCAKLQKNT